VITLIWQARQALLRRDLQELMQMLPPEAAEDTIVDGKKNYPIVIEHII
jgi:hypothetical protein